MYTTYKPLYSAWPCHIPASMRLSCMGVMTDLSFSFFFPGEFSPCHQWHPDLGSTHFCWLVRGWQLPSWQSLSVVQYSYSLLLWLSLAACKCSCLILECTSEVLKHNGGFRMVWLIVMTYCMTTWLHSIVQRQTLGKRTGTALHHLSILSMLVYIVTADSCHTIKMLQYLYYHVYVLPRTQDHRYRHFIM